MSVKASIPSPTLPQQPDESAWPLCPNSETALVRYASTAQGEKHKYSARIVTAEPLKHERREKILDALNHGKSRRCPALSISKTLRERQSRNDRTGHLPSIRTYKIFARLTAKVPRCDNRALYKSSEMSVKANLPRPTSCCGHTCQAPHQLYLRVRR